jgi:hypothetical protein
MKLIVTKDEMRQINDAVLEGANLVNPDAPNPALYHVYKVVVDLPGFSRQVVQVEVEA